MTDLLTFDGRESLLREHAAWLGEYRAETARIHRAAYNVRKRDLVMSRVKAYADAEWMSAWEWANLYTLLDWRVTFPTPVMELIKQGKELVHQFKTSPRLKVGAA